MILEKRETENRNSCCFGGGNVCGPQLQKQCFRHLFLPYGIAYMIRLIAESRVTWLLNHQNVELPIKSYSVSCVPNIRKKEHAFRHLLRDDETSFSGHL